VESMVRLLHHEQTGQATASERALLRTLEGGCQVPIGTYGRVTGDQHGTPTLMLDAMVGSLDGRQVVRGTISGSPAEAERLGQALANNLLNKGARAILDAIRADAHDSTPT